MTHSNLMRLSEILHAKESIKLHAQEILDIRIALDEVLTDEEKVKISYQIKDRVQMEAKEAFVANGGWGSVYMATGSGKSKIGVDLAVYDYNVCKGVRPSKVLIVVPTEKLRDENWKEEFEKWEAGEVWNTVERTCYASLNKYEGQHFTYVVLDEGHNATDNNVVKFFAQNTVDHCMVLTATKPRGVDKERIFSDLKFSCVYELTLDEAVMLGIVAPYDITIVTMYLDSVDKYIEGGSATNRFFQTEKSRYEYLSRSAFSRPTKMGFIQRMRFIYDLRSKTKAAKLILVHIIPKELRTLIFCGGKKQAVELCDRTYFSKPSLPKKLPNNPSAAKLDKFVKDTIEYEQMMKVYEGDAAFDDFKSGIIDRMACVDALNEGHNLNDIDVAFVVQLNRNAKNLIQRIGRAIRYKPGHRGKIIILCVEDSMDKEWVKSATAGFSVANITTVELSRLRLELDTISF